MSEENNTKKRAEIGDTIIPPENFSPTNYKEDIPTNFSPTNYKEDYSPINYARSYPTDYSPSSYKDQGRYVEEIVDNKNDWPGTDLSKSLEPYKDVFTVGGSNIYTVAEPVQTAINNAKTAMESLAAEIAAAYSSVTAQKEAILEERRRQAELEKTRGN